jgi:hypothetical protein
MLEEVLKRLDALELKVDYLLKQVGKQNGADHTAQIVTPRETVDDRGKETHSSQ